MSVLQKTFSSYIYWAKIVFCCNVAIYVFHAVYSWKKVTLTAFSFRLYCNDVFNGATPKSDCCSFSHRLRVFFDCCSFSHWLGVLFLFVLKKFVQFCQLIDETTAPPEYHRQYFLAVNYFKVCYKSWFKVTFPWILHKADGQSTITSATRERSHPFPFGFPFR